MKKILFLTAICAAVMVGCTNDEETQQSEISFSPLSYKTSKAIIEGSTYKTTDPEFGVFAYYSANNDWTANGAAASLYINNSTIEYDGTNKIWACATKSYWPLNGSLTFYAYSPESANASVASDTKVLTIADFVVSTDVTNPNAQVDLLYSKPSDAKGLTSNGSNYTSESGTSAKKGVSIKFRHALAQVLVKVQVADSYTNTDFKVRKIELQAMKNKGTFTLTPTFGDSYQESAVWTLSDPTISQVIFNGSSDVLTTTYNQVGNYILVMPQGLTASNQKLSIEYEMTNKSVSPNVTSSTTKTVDLINGEFNSIGINKKITLNITLSAEEILYAPSVEAWDETSGPVNY